MVSLKKKKKKKKKKEIIQGKKYMQVYIADIKHLTIIKILYKKTKKRNEKSSLFKLFLQKVLYNFKD